MLRCAELRPVVQIIKKLPRKGEVHAFCSVEAAIGGEIGIGAPSAMDFFLGERCCKMV